MVKSFKFLLQFALANVAAILGFAVVVTVGAILTGVPNGADMGAAGLFRTYFGSFPFMCIIMVYIFAFALCTSNLNMALSFGAKRRDFFWGVQGALVFYTLVCWGLQAVMASIPTRWVGADRLTTLMSLALSSFWQYPLFLMSVMALGCLVGLLFVRSKVVGVSLMVFSVLVFLATLVLLLLSSDGAIQLWGDLPLVLTLVMALILVVSELLIWRTIKRSVVR